jgi:hypothetical protein
MAKIFVGSSSNFTASGSNMTVNGTGGASTTLVVKDTANALTTDANIGNLQLAGKLADYTFQTVAGHGVQIAKAGVVVVTVPSINNQMAIAFADGSANLVQTGATQFALGGGAIATTPTSFSASGVSSFNAGVVSDTKTVRDASNTKAFMQSGETLVISDKNIKVNGTSSTTDKLVIQAGATGVVTDANIDLLDVSGALSDYNYQFVSGVGFQLQSQGAVVATLPSINSSSVKVAFTDGSTDLVQTGASSFTLGSQVVNTTVKTFAKTDLGGTFDTAVTSSSGGTAGGTGSTGTGTTGGISVAAAGTYPLTSAADVVTVSAGNYAATLTGFAVGDKIDLPDAFLNTLTLSNTSATDGTLILQGNDSNNNVITLTLTGINATTDASIYGIASFKAAFGSGSLF